MSITDFVYAMVTICISLGCLFWIAGWILWSKRNVRNKRVVLQLMLARVVLWLATAILFVFFKNWICAALFAILCLYGFVKWISNHM